MFPYSLPSVGPTAADLGVQAVSPQVTKPSTAQWLPLLSAMPAVTFPAHKPVPNYTACCLFAAGLISIVLLESLSCLTVYCRS